MTLTGLCRIVEGCHGSRWSEDATAESHKVQQSDGDSTLRWDSLQANPACWQVCVCARARACGVCVCLCACSSSLFSFPPSFSLYLIPRHACLYPTDSRPSVILRDLFFDHIPLPLRPAPPRHPRLLSLLLAPPSLSFALSRPHLVQSTSATGFSVWPTLPSSVPPPHRLPTATKTGTEAEKETETETETRMQATVSNRHGMARPGVGP